MKATLEHLDPLDAFCGRHGTPPLRACRQGIRRAHLRREIEAGRCFVGFNGRSVGGLMIGWPCVPWNAHWIDPDSDHVFIADLAVRGPAAARELATDAARAWPKARGFIALRGAKRTLRFYRTAHAVRFIRRILKPLKS